MKDEETMQPFRKVVGLHRIENSVVMKHTLASLVHVASTKTSEEYARSSVKNVLKELEENYGFLRYIEMKDVKYLENTYDLSSLDFLITRYRNHPCIRQ